MPCIIITSKLLGAYKREHFGYSGKNPGQQHFQYCNEMPTTVKSKSAVTFNNFTYMVEPCYITIDFWIRGKQGRTLPLLSLVIFNGNKNPIIFYLSYTVNFFSA